MNTATSKLWGDNLELSVFSEHHETHLLWSKPVVSLALSQAGIQLESPGDGYTE